MDQRIVEILMYVIGEIQAHRMKVDEIDGISDELMQHGFSPREVATAISLFSNRIGPDGRRLQVSAPLSHLSHRVLHDVERQYVSPEAYGYLIQMQHLGILDVSDVEELIEHCMLTGNLDVGADEIKMIVATHLLEKDPGFASTGFYSGPLRPWSDHVQ